MPELLPEILIFVLKENSARVLKLGGGPLYEVWMVVTAKHPQSNGHHPNHSEVVDHRLDFRHQLPLRPIPLKY